MDMTTYPNLISNGNKLNANHGKQTNFEFTTLQYNLTISIFEEEIVPDARTAPLISNDTKHILDIVFQLVLFNICSLFGIVVNIINIVVYRKQGLRDSITLGFFTLSVSDLIVVVCPLSISACYVAKFLIPDSPINFVGFHYVSAARLRQMAFSFSNVLTAFLSLERCCCVILPFKVKTIFTRKRTFLVIIGMLLFHTACYTPIFATHQLRWLINPKRNNTYGLGVWFAPGRKKIEAFNFTVMSIVTPTISQIVVICSTIIMTYSLRRSSQFRQSATGTSTDKENAAPTLSSRDARLVRAMVFLGVILSICNLPYLVLSYSILLEPELNMNRAYHNTYSVMSCVTYVLASLNASVNVFVYYNNSSKYRQIFDEMFSCRRQIDEKDTK